MIIELKDINKTYTGAVPLHVLKGINLGIERGELVSIMGASFLAEKSSVLALETMREKYNYGKANATEFEQARSSYIQAVSDLMQAKYESIFAGEFSNFIYFHAINFSSFYS